MTRPFARRSILLACCVTACSLAAIRCDNPAGPDSERDGQPPHVVKELRIEGNLHLAGPNDTSQLRALAVMADGTVLDVTRFVVWQTNGHAIVSETGVMKGYGFGVDVLTVRYAGARTTVAVRVMPAGMYVLEGRVRERGNLPVAGVFVEVTQGATSGKRVQTDMFGRFSLTPVDGGPITLRLTASGYLRTSRELVMNDDMADIELELTPALSPVDLSGEYQLTIEAAATCELPPEAMKRQYAATIVQDGARLTVTLSGATFLPCDSRPPRADHFGGRVLDGSKVTLQLGMDDYSCTHDVLEQLTATSFLEFIGTVTGVATGRTISAELDGYIGVSPLPRGGAGSAQIASCSPARHSVRFTR